MAGGVHASVALASIIIDESEWKRLLEGPISRDLVRRGIRVQNQAKANASQPPPSFPGSGPSVRTGRLRGSITLVLDEDYIGPYVDVGTNVEYAAFVELGTYRMGARPYLRPALAQARD